MTNTPDTSPEAVERPIRFRPVVSADGLAAARMDRNGNYVMYADYVAERDALKAELAEAVGLLKHLCDEHLPEAEDHFDYIAEEGNHAQIEQAESDLGKWRKIAAFLARHQKETDI